MANLEIWSIGEYIFLRTMTMHIQKSCKVTTILKFHFFSQLFESHDLWISDLIFSLKGSIEIITQIISSKIAKHYSIRINHWNNLNDVMFQKLFHLGLRRRRCQTLHKPFYHVRSTCLSRMYSSRYQYDILVTICYRIILIFNRFSHH